MAKLFLVCLLLVCSQASAAAIDKPAIETDEQDKGSRYLPIYPQEEWVIYYYTRLLIYVKALHTSEKLKPFHVFNESIYRKNISIFERSLELLLPQGKWKDVSACINYYLLFLDRRFSTELIVEASRNIARLPFQEILATIERAHLDPSHRYHVRRFYGKLCKSLHLLENGNASSSSSSFP